MHNVTLIKGDGIGPSIMEEAVKVIDATGVQINWEEAEAGMGAYEKYGTPIPDETIASFTRNRVAFKGPLTTLSGGGFRSINVVLRQKFNLYANVRPARIWPGVNTRFEDVDIVPRAVYGITTMYQGAFYAVEMKSPEWISLPIKQTSTICLCHHFQSRGIPLLK